jgi:hypothetical protein
MPRIEPEWAVVGEAEDIVKQLVSMYPEKYGHIDPSRVGVAAITNKPRPETADWYAKIKGVTQPEAMYCSKSYIILFHMNTWEEFNATQRQHLVNSQLARIPDPPEGEILKKDLQDVKSLVKAFGVDYLFAPGLPSLLDPAAKQAF